jgi:oxalate decarboxylase/phosphoglucose isomerase-like protein (cupin superfamily)
MTLLTQVAGLPISISDDTEDVYYDSQDVDCIGCGIVSLREISPSLLNKALMYPELVYKHHREVKLKSHASDWQGKYAYDVIYLPDGLLGIEYIKTHIFYYSGNKVAAVVQVISGTLTVMLQKNRKKENIYDFDSHVEEALIVEAGQGEKIAIPANYYYTFVNTSTEPVVFSRVVAQDHVADYSHLRRESGLAYYLIAKNARQEVVLNPRYKTAAEVKNISVDDLNARLGYSANKGTPLYDETIMGVTDFNYLFA